MQLFAPFNPAGRLEVNARVCVEDLEIAFLAPQEERDAVVGARQHEWNRAGREPHQAVAAQRVAEQHRFVLALVDSVQHLLETTMHGARADVVQALGQELDVDPIGGACHRCADLAVDDLAGDQLESHGCSLGGQVTRASISPLSASVIFHVAPAAFAFT
jgi:hypothetical protein